jgi:hypothetical protein
MMMFQKQWKRCREKIYVRKSLFYALKYRNAVEML